MHLDTHAVDHADDVFDLLRVDHVVEEVIVDFGIGQVALFQALADQLLDVGLRGLTFVGHVGSHRGNLSEENPALYRRRGCLTCFVAGNPPGTGSGGGVTVFETTPLVLSKREKRRRYALRRDRKSMWMGKSV